ncbi:MAG: response regulator [Chloroflexota bacterium]
MAHILVIDDERMLRFLIRSVFESAGHTVAEAPDGRVAFDILEMYPRLFDLIVLDLQMAHMGGIEFLSILHSEMVYPPIIVLTGHIGSNKNTLGQKVSGYLTKPFKNRDLIEMVNSRLNLNSSQRLA